MSCWAANTPKEVISVVYVNSSCAAGKGPSAPRLKSRQRNLEVFPIRRRREAPDSKLTEY
jgi:hypothetical protein